MDAFPVFIQYASVGLGEIDSECCLGPFLRFICKLTMLGKSNGPTGTIWMQFHTTTLGIELVIGLLGGKTTGKHLEEDLALLSIVAALDTISVKQFGAFFHPGSRVAAVAHQVEVPTFEESFVEIVYVFKSQTSIFQHPIPGPPFSMASVPDEHCK